MGKVSCKKAMKEKTEIFVSAKFKTSVCSSKQTIIPVKATTHLKKTPLIKH